MVSLKHFSQKSWSSCSVLTLCQKKTWILDCLKYQTMFYNTQTWTTGVVVYSLCYIGSVFSKRTCDTIQCAGVGTAQLHYCWHAHPHPVNYKASFKQHVICQYSCQIPSWRFLYERFCWQIKAGSYLLPASFSFSFNILISQMLSALEQVEIQ